MDSLITDGKRNAEFIRPNALQRFDLSRKVVILTGGAGLYGRGLTAALADANATIIIASRNVSSLQQIVDSEAQRGNTVFAEALDQGDEASVHRLCERVLLRHGAVHGLVNNAVLRTMQGPDDSAERWAESMRVNATGLFTISKVFGNAMAAQGTGSIVNVGSIQGMVGANFWLYEGTEIGTAPDYFFHKGGMLNYTRYLAAHLGRRGVRVNCVSPGGFYNSQDSRFVERYAAMTMLGRMAGNDDLAGAIIFLLSDASSYITGANLPVDGGYTAK